MAGRPTKKRTAKSFASEVMTLTRLRMAIRLDRSLPRDLADAAVVEIDALETTLIKLISEKEKSNTKAA
jgi:hypothetical protein